MNVMSISTVDDKVSTLSMTGEINNSMADRENQKAPNTKENVIVAVAAEEDAQYLTGLRLGLVVIGLCLAVLLVGLVSVILHQHEDNVTKPRTG